jgi:hypothetical protein
MRHDDGRFLFVQVPDERMRGKEKDSRAFEDVNPAELSPVWARPGAYNVGSTAVYIGRKARRSARRSMSTEHYHVKWSSNGSARINGKYLWNALMPEDYTPIGEAIQLIRTKAATARAINREIILANGRAGIKVVLRGQVAGHIRDNLFIPNNEMAPLAKLARSRLAQEGVLC